MVFSGRPSTACYACRKRRLKCDRAPAGCGQCRRKGIECAGYFDPTTLRVRDETDRVAHKIGKAPISTKLSPSAFTATSVSVSKPSPSPASTPSSITSNRSLSPFTYTSTPSPSEGTALLAYKPEVSDEDDFNKLITITRLPSPEIGQLSIGHFFSSYVLATPFEPYLDQFCQLNLQQDESLSLALNATALAAFSRRIRSPDCEARARKTYAKALTDVNKRLQNPETAVQDGTLAMVLLLGLFEAIVFRGGSSPKEWTAHTWGAMRLLMLRGQAQFLSPVSLKLFTHASTNIKTACIQGGIDLPLEFRTLMEQAEAYLPSDGPGPQISPIMNRIIRFRAEFQVSPRFELFKDAWMLDCEVLEVMTKLKAKSVSLSKTSDTFAFPQYKYIDSINVNVPLREAKLWNTLNLVRILLMHFVYEGMEWGRFESTSWPDSSLETQTWIEYLKAYATSQMRDISEQILTTVPTFMGPNGSDMVFTTPARSLVWPLSVIEIDKLCPKEAQQFARKMLEKLAGELNLPEALLEKREIGSSDDWLHLFHLG